MCLPVFLSGCKQLLMMVGKTYMSRLWCVMEVFIYMRIKGATSIGELSSQLTIKLLGEDATSISERIARFEAAKAQCRHDRDRQKLLAVIEASFGTTAPFDDLVVKVFNEQVIGVKGLQRQIDTMRRQMVEQQEVMRRQMVEQQEATRRHEEELEALRAQVRMLVDKRAAKEQLAVGLWSEPPTSFSA